jgi:peptidoglycan/xylan/chitin deacetylase (PgdA/CDA1 family)
MLRGDAIATLYFFQPLRRVISSGRVRVPILMYHSVSDSPPDARHAYFQTVTSPGAFAEHMRLLDESGFSTISLSQAVEHLGSSTAGIQDVRILKPVVITFDDGYRNFRTHAFPALERYGFGATVFLPTGLISDSPINFKGFECLTWSEVRDLQKAGIQFGSHTVTHPQLKALDWKQIQSEVRSSKETIEDRLSCRVSSFSYPYAFPETDTRFRQGLTAVLEESGYENGVSTIIGTADREDDRFFLKRLPVNSCDCARLFSAKLGGAYDWLHTLQYASKFLRQKM